MTVLYSIYTPQGIIFTADSMLTKRLGPLTYYASSRDPKVFRIPKLGDHSAGSILGYYGLAQVGGKPMAEFLRSTISRWGGSQRLEDFAAYLIDRLKQTAHAHELNSVVGFHLGGFERRESYRVPIFVYIRNAEADEDTGAYHEFPSWELRWDEQMMGRTLAQWAPREARQALELFRRDQNEGIPMWFRNGDLQSFAGPTAAVELAAKYLIRLPNFRMPTTIGRWIDLAQILVNTTSDLVRATYIGGTPTIGGKAYALALDWDG